MKYQQAYDVTFVVNTRRGVVAVNLLSAPFATHNFLQGQRAIKLTVAVPRQASGGAWAVRTTAPPSANVCPQQYYMMFCLQAGVPGRAVWIKME